MNNTHPNFSVIIPCYNNGSTLARSVDSVLNQTYSAHEIIIVDDGSTDNSGEIAREYGDKVRYVGQKNSGVSAARNAGVRVATGDWLAFLDADDCYFPNRLQEHAEWILADQEIDFLLADQEFRRFDGEFMHLTIGTCDAGKYLLEANPGKVNIGFESEYFQHLIADGFGEIRTISIPRTKFLQLGGFAEDKKIGEDLHFFIRLYAHSAKGGVVNKPLAVYYIYPNSALRKDVIGSQRQFVKTLESLAGFISKAQNPIRYGYKEKLRRSRLSLSYALLREGKRFDALQPVLKTMSTNPSLITFRDFLSILKG